MDNLKPEFISKYIENLKKRDCTAARIKTKIASVDKFIEWAHKQHFIGITDFKQLKESIANIQSQLKADKPQNQPISPSPTGSPTGNRYISFITIIIFASFLGVGIYNQFFKKPTTPLAYPSSVTKGARTLSFQGRLTDTLGNPIITSTNVQFNLYKTSTNGTSLYSTGVCSVSPDIDGIFSVLIGKDCGAEINSSVFTENANVFLGVTIGTDQEMSPRQQIANVGYAINSETLQGMPPGTDLSNIPFINSSGSLVIAAASPKLQSTSGTFTIEAQTLTVTTPAESNGNISLMPDGTGNVGIGTTNPISKLDVSGGSIRTDGQLISTVSSGTAPLSVSSNTLVANLNADLLDGHDGSYYLSTSGIGGTQNYITKFSSSGVLGNSTIYDNGNIGIGITNPTQLLDVNGNINVSNGSTYKISGIDVLSASTLGVGVTSSSLVQVGALNGGSIASGFGAIDTGLDNITTTGTVGTAGTTTFTGASGTFTSLNNSGSYTQTGTSNNAFTGTSTFSNAAYSAFFTGGNVGIGTTNPTNGKLEVNGRMYTTDFTMTNGAATGYTLTSVDGSGNASWTDVSSVAGPWTLVGSNLYPDATTYNVAIGATNAGTAKLYVNGNVGIGTTAPSALLSVGTTSQFQVSSVGAVTAVGVNSGSGLIEGTGGLTVSGNTTLATTAGNTVNIGNSTGALVLASGGTSSWTNTSGNLSIGTSVSGTMSVDSAGTLNLGTTNSTSTSLGKASTTLTINPTSWTATPTISGLITATSGLTTPQTGDAITMSGAGANINFSGAGLAQIKTAAGQTLALMPGTTGNVGIGNTNPTTGQLVVNGRTYTTDFTMTNGASTGYALISDVSGNASWTDVSSIAGPWTLVGSNLYPDATTYNVAIGATNAGTAKLYVDGNVGIGTTGPTEALDVVGNVNVSSVYKVGGTEVLSASTLGVGVTTSSLVRVGILNSGSIASGFGAIDTGSDNITTIGTIGTVGTTTFTGASGTFTSLNNSGSYTQTGTSNNAFTGTSTFSNATYSAFFTGGNVGIGETVPIYKLDIAGDLRTTTGAYFATTSGNVGIGTTNPLGMLSVGATNTSPGLLVTSGGNVGLGTTNPLGRLSVGTSNTVPNFFVATGGNVGIGTSNPTALFSVGASSQFKVNTSGNVTFAATLTPTSNFTLGAASKTGTLTTSDWAVSSTGALTGISGINNDGAYTQTGTSANAFTGTSTFSNATYSAFFTGGNVGIGTTTPGSALDVKGGFRISGSSSGYVGLAAQSAAGSVTYTLPNADGTNNYVLTTDGSGNLSWSDKTGGTPGTITSINGDSSAAQTINTGNGLNINNSGATHTLSLDLTYAATWTGTHTFSNGTYSALFTGGNVGIGETTPIYKLDIAGDLRTTTGAYFATTSGNVGIGTTSPAGLFDVNGKLTVLSGGNVGIGNTNPTTGQLVVNGRTYTTDFTMTNGAATGYALISDVSGNASWTDVSSIAGPWTLLGNDLYPDLTTYNVAIGATVAGTAKLYVNGNVGIGTTSPIYSLDISGNLRTTTDAYFATTSGNVGVGTTNPSALFAVGASSQFQIGSTGAISTNFVGDALTMSGIGANINFSGAGLAQIKTATSQNLALMPGGNVGIGTTSPLYKLHIISDDAVTDAITGLLSLEHTTTGTAANGLGVGLWFKGEDASGTLAAQGMIQTKWLDATAANKYSQMEFLVRSGASWDDTPEMVIKNDGNVGIGTTNPSALLSVGSTSQFQVGLTGAISTNFVGDALTMSGVGANINFSGAGLAQIKTAASQNLALMPGTTGNVGIGGTSPSSLFTVGTTSQFQVNSSGNVTFASTLTPTSNFTLGSASYTGTLTTSDWVISSTGALTGISGINNDGAYTQTGTTANTFTGTSTFSNATYSALFTGGSVGIGTTAPTTALQVAGNITANAAPTLTSTSLVLTSVDTTNTVGQWTSIAIGSDGLPVISEYDSTNQYLRVVHCGNTSCSSGNTTTAVDTTGTVGQYSSIAIGSDGLPVISEYDSTNGDLRVVHCNNVSCTSSTITAVDTTGSVGWYTSIAIGTDGLPVISEYDATAPNLDLHVVHCGNTSCSSGNTITAVDTTDDVGQYSSIAIGSDGLPIISEYVNISGDLRVVHCGNTSCSSGNTITAVDTTGNVGKYTSIAIGSDGLPIISEYDSGNADLRVVHCGNTSCSSGNTITAVDTTGTVGQWTSIAIGSDGLPIISEYDSSPNNDLRVVHCSNVSCTSSTITAVDTTNNVGQYTSIAIGTDGLPVISEYDGTTYDLRVVRCGNISCSGNSTSTLAGGYQLGGFMSNPRSYSIPFQNVNTFNISNPSTFQNLGFYTGGSLRLAITPGGNVGIGTTTPLSKLSILGNAAIGSSYGAFSAPSNGLIVEGNVGIGTTDTSYNLNVNGSINATSYYVSGVIMGTTASGSVTGQTLYWNGASWQPSSVLFNNNTNVGVGTTAPAGLFDVNGKLTVLSGGNVGIGTTAPGKILDVLSTAQTVANFQSSNVANVAGITFTNPAGSAYFGSNGTSAEIRANGTTAMTILTTTGNVGVGSTNPTSLFNVGASNQFAVGSTGAISTNFVGDALTMSGVGANINFSGAGLAQIITAAGQTLALMPGTTGNVGIGGTVPVFKLDISGDLRTTTGAYFATTSGSVGIGTTNATQSLDIAGASGNMTFSSSTGPHQILTGGTTNLALMPGGNVGIGGTSPSSLFAIGASSQFQVGSTGAISTNFVGDALTMSGVGANINFSGAGLAQIKTATSQNLSLMPGGNVGIGTTGTLSQKLHVNGNIIADKYCDTGDLTCASYYVDPAAVTTSISVNGNIELNGNSRTIRAGTAGYNNSITIDSGTATTVLRGGASATEDVSVCVSYNGTSECNGKLDAGTVDPPYTINGKKYATYLSAMTGVKEETTGTIATSQYVTDTGYQYTVDFNNLPEGSDLWLFSKTTNLRNNISKLVALLTPADNTRVWYKLDSENHKLIFYSSRPTTISYRLTAPRFDYEQWNNTRSGGGAGFVLNDPDVVGNVTLNSDGNITPTSYTVQKTNNELRTPNYELKDQLGNIIEEIAGYSKATIANLTTGLIKAEEITTDNFTALTSNIQHLTSNILVVNEKIISPIVETQDITATGTAKLNQIETNEIKSADKDIVVNLGRDNPRVVPTDENKGDLAKLIIKGLDDKTVASIDAAGNATFSGQLAANTATISGELAAGSLTTQEASVSGTLTAKEVKADNIDNMTSNIQDLTSNINDVQSLLAKIKDTPLPNAQYYQNLDPSIATSSSVILGSVATPESINPGSRQSRGFSMQSEQARMTYESLTVTGSTNLYTVTVADSLLTGNILVKDNSILALASELKLSALESINFFDGQIVMAKDGTITTKGTLVAQGGIKTNTIQAVNDGNDINIKLSTVGVGSSDPQTGEETSPLQGGSKLKIQNSQGDEVASIDASGSAKFNGLSLNKYMDATSSAAIIAAPDNFNKNGLYAPAIETKSETAGVGIVPQNSTEVVVYNDNIKESSLVYLTPTSNIQDPTSILTVIEKHTCSTNLTSNIQDPTSSCKPYFKVAIPTATPSQINFNWLIIN